MSTDESALKRARTEGGEVATLTKTADPAVPAKEPAMTFPYKLDVFQQKSIDALEDGDSVLVSAHTSAGKTTVAAYAIAKALRERRRVIYTSPIKALSNQKFREFSEKWDSVGLMTGDTTIKPDSDCLVMTTEILRSMLYRGTEMLREVGCVIFDEVHYMRDKARGVVWEETIIMLPEGCQYVFLSATIPNAREFADWVQHIHPRTTCHVIHTDYRPVPLQHFIYPHGADGIFLVVDEGSKFRDDNYRKAMAAMGGASGADSREGAGPAGAAARPKDARRKQAGGQNQPIMHIIRLVMDHNMSPVIVFSFAKAECERNALALAKLNLNNDEESALVSEVFNNAMESLSEDDRKLPAVEHLLPLLKRGVGIHHSGLLPILKEVVELLFQAGLVKVLFSTETFSMGLNMPARTVIFTDVKKFDGEGQRYLTGGEYIQMSGRAGRRGLDKVGIVIAMISEAVDPVSLRSLMGGGADVLLSSFHLTYNMILNLLRVEDVDPEFMMTRSFSQFQRERGRPELEAKAGALQSAASAIVIADEEIFEEFKQCETLLTKLQEEEARFRCRPKYLKPFLSSGRIVRVVRRSDNADFGWGICVGYDLRDRSLANEAATKANTDDTAAYTVDVAVICKSSQAQDQPAGSAAAADPAATAPTNGGALTATHRPCHVTEYTSATAELQVLTFAFGDIQSAARFRINMPATFASEAGRTQGIQTLAKLHTTYKDDVPLLTPQELGIDDESYTTLLGKIEKLKKQRQSNELVSSPTPALQADFARFKEKLRVVEELKNVKEELRALSRTVLKDDLKHMLRVLRRLDYVDKDSMIMRKGRIACEITTSDENELLLTEVLFKGTLNDMECEMVVALLSCLVNQSKTPDNFSLPEEYHAPLNDLKEIVNRIATVSLESGVIARTGSKEVEKVFPSLMDVTYKWAKGAKFIDLVALTPAYEGEIVRMMRRLEELLRQLAGAARSPAIGSIELHDKFNRGIQLIKRDIVFASSLYL